MNDGFREHLADVNALLDQFLPFFRWTWVSRYQSVSILDFIGARDGRT